ncbi:DUF2442 domain-containing protein [Paenibacillus sp. FSL M7-0420]|uniref:DUF2442 domain-containing protein n=1 Tax=Paenibacillus sp. FSL M7-0420 TaxID=2921609 RepID=UPI0030F9BD3C
MNKIVVSVKAAPNFMLLLEFEGKEYRVFDFKAYAETKSGFPLEIIKNRVLFESVRIDGTGTISWDNDFDIDVEFLYNNSIAKSDSDFD